MKDKLSTAKKAALSVYNAGGEHYHFNMGCLLYGDEQMLTAMRKEIQKDGMPFEDAAVKAAEEFKMMRRLESGEGRFKTLRESLEGAASNLLSSPEGCLM